MIGRAGYNEYNRCDRCSKNVKVKDVNFFKASAKK